MTRTLSKGRYSYPVENGEAHISKRPSPAHVRELKHSIDFIVPVGTKVYASADGVVVDLKSDGRLGGNSKKFEKHGNHVEIWHEQSDEYSQYEHLSKVSVERGQSVKRGDPIGESGDTGWLGGLGPHLHWSVGKYGKYSTVVPRMLRGSSR